MWRRILPDLRRVRSIAASNPRARRQASYTLRSKINRDYGMRIINGYVFGLIAASLTAFAGARGLAPDQPPIWSTKPDVNAFEKIENDRLETAQRSIDKIVAVKG